MSQLQQNKTEQSLAAATEGNFSSLFRKLLIKDFSILVPVLVISLLAIFVPYFYSANNIASILINTSILTIVGLGSTTVLAARGLDLSVGSNVAWSACVFGVVFQTFGFGIGILAGLLAGIFAGVVNGILVVEFGVPSFVTTLGMLGILRGASLLVTNGSPVTVPGGGLEKFATGNLFRIPMLFVCALVLLVVAWVLFNKTAWGKHVRAFGGQPDAAIDSGVKLRTTFMSVFIGSGIAAALGGVLLASQLGVVDGTLATGFELQVIAVVVLGGASLSGGRGNMIGTMLAAFLLAQISSGLNLLNVKDYYQYLATGVLLVGALALDTARTKIIRRGI